MTDNSFDKRRQALSRPYALVAESRVRKYGHHPEKGLRAKYAAWKLNFEYEFQSHYFAEPPRWRLFLRRFGGPRVFPDFCVVGPMKSGTSDLAVSMLMHPNVLLPLAKEFYLPDMTRWNIYYPTERQKRRHIRSKGAALAPFVAPSLHWMEIAHNLAKYKPDMKIVIALRDPAERVYSHWKWEYLLTGKRRAASLPFLSDFRSYVDWAFRRYPESITFSVCGAQPLQTSIYYHSVGYWLECFGKKNILFVDIGEYFADRAKVLREIQSFVGLPSTDLPLTGSAVNENPLQLPPPDGESMERLREFYRPHNERLWPLIGRRFAWL